MSTKRFEEVDKRFEKVDKRFEDMDKRFEDMDKRFEDMDKRFEGIETRLDRLESEVVKTNLTMENEINPKLAALFDEYKQNADKLDRIEKEVSYLYLSPIIPRGHIFLLIKVTAEVVRRTKVQNVGDLSDGFTGGF